MDFFFSFLQLLSLLMQVFSKTPNICSCKRPTEACLGFFNNLPLGFCTMQTHAHTRVRELFSYLSDISQRFFPELFQITGIPENPQKGPCFPIFSWVSCSPAAGTTIPLVLDSCSLSARPQSLHKSEEAGDMLSKSSSLCSNKKFFVFLDKHFNKLNLPTLQANKIK